MPQSIFIQVGQCGNQIGYCFWDIALKEYNHFKLTSVEEMNTFFKHSDIEGRHLLKARGILIDMEEGVISEILRRPLKNLFDAKQLITDVSGSGNNWAIGNKFYGLKYRHYVEELVRREIEMCDNLQCFFVLHSMGGGTGSGMGTAVLEALHDNFQKIPRFTFAVFPSVNDDVITSPYNAVLANNLLIEHADCVIPFDNEALTGTSHHLQFQEARKPLRAFDEMNNNVADVILNLTCSSRFPGSLNVDVNEIITNLTPYPRLHYLISSISQSSKVDQSFAEVFSGGRQLFQSSLKRGMLLSCALLCRGPIAISDVQRNISRLKEGIKCSPWSEGLWKTGMCPVPPLNSPHSILLLANSSCVVQPLTLLKERFARMYRRRAHLHHFLEVDGVETDLFDSALTNLNQLIQEYRDLETLKLIESRLRVFACSSVLKRKK